MPHSWDSFFVLAGSAAATLMGLLFVGCHGRRYWLLHVAHSRRHPRLFDAGSRSFRYRAIAGTSTASAMAVLVANRDHFRHWWAYGVSL
jgi:hypothetical protein